LRLFFNAIFLFEFFFFCANPTSLRLNILSIFHYFSIDFIDAPKGTNLLVNPGFEQPLVTSPLLGWSCQGQTDDPRGGALSLYSLDHREGEHSGICYARLAEWAGPGQYIGKNQDR